MAKSYWFVADRDGLRSLQEGKPKSFVVRELVQNSWDEEGVTEVRVDIQPVPNAPKATLHVFDDAPEGFYDLRHAYTLFADTRKRKDPTKRGRFNLGEKQVLALCDEAVIKTTTGSVYFDKDGTRRESKKNWEKTTAGSVFKATLNITREELEDVIRAVKMFIPPPKIKTFFNEEEITERECLGFFITSLKTEYADEDGVMRATARKTKVEVFEPLEGEIPTLYECGLPVCETGDRWHYNVHQRVPLTLDRDVVRPAYLRDLRAEVLNEFASDLNQEEAAETWVTDALDDERMEPEAVKTIITAQQGENVFVPVPGDSEANERAIDAGYRPVSGGSYSKEAWGNIRDVVGLLPSSVSLVGATQVTGGVRLKEDDLTDGMRKIREMSKLIAKEVLGVTVRVEFVKSKATCSAQYGERTLTFNVSRLRRRWFNTFGPKQVSLIVHELGHQFGGHYDTAYHEAICKIAGELYFWAPAEVEESVK